MMMMMMMTTTNCQALICPDLSSNCTTKGYDEQYVYHMRCSGFGLQNALPVACQYPLTVRELTLEPGTTNIRTIQGRAFDGLRVQTLVLSGLGIETVNESAFVWLADNLQELSLADNRLMELPDGVFSPLTNLAYLQLQNNRLSTISRHLLDGLANLTVLDLSGNQISNIDLQAWVPVPLISRLQLYDNVIGGTLNFARLSGLTHLQDLRLDGNWISELTPDAFSLLPKLRKLNIAKNSIPTLPGSVFSTNAELEEVDASQNKISGLESDVFNKTRRLVTLSLNDNRIHTLPIYVFRDMYNLQTLHLQHNSISGILSNSISGLSSLRYLDLSENQIGSLPLGIFDPLGLVHTLSLANNQIAFVARRPFESMTNLVELDFSNNRLSSVDSDWFLKTAKLARLRLDGNRLTVIHPGAFSSVPELEEIHVNRNLLSSIDGGLFGNCSSVSNLDLSFNPLRHIHHAETTFDGLTSLQQMNLSTTCLTELSFGGDSVTSLLPNLTELDLSANTLHNISSSTFAAFPGLRRLHLSANDIDQFDNSTFSSLSSLELLDLSHNALMSDEQLSTVLSVLPPSTVVDLSWNLLTSVDVLPQLPGGVYLAGNPLRCDCNSSSWLTADFTRLLDAELTACLDTQQGRPAVLVCHWTTCSANTTDVSPADVLILQNGCVTDDNAMSYLSVPQRRPPVVCPWDAVPPVIQTITVDLISTTSIHVSWNLTSATNVTVTIVSEPANSTGNVYEFSANVSNCTISNLTSGGSYYICVTTSSGERSCVIVVLPVEQTTSTSPASLKLRMSATSTASSLAVTWDISTSGPADIVLFQLRWLENGTSNEVSTGWIDKSNRSYTISGLRAATVYVVCVNAVAEIDQTVFNTTKCDYFTTQPVTDTDGDNTLFIIIAAAAGALFFLILFLIIIICCCCCRRHDKASQKPTVTVQATESTRSVNSGSLAQHSVVSMSVYENLP